MEFYKIIYIVEDKANTRLLKLTERYAKVNGWNERDLLQFAVTATCKSDIEAKLNFLEEQIIPLEEEWKKKIYR